MRNVRFIHLALLLVCVPRASYAAQITSASAKGAPTSAAVSIEHDLPHPVYEEAEVLRAGGWTIKLLPANLVPLQASRDGEVVLLRDPADNSYYRWYDGFLENLGQSLDERVSMNNAGITAATNYRHTDLYYHSFVKRWRREDKTFDYLYNPTLFSMYIPAVEGEMPASIRYSRSVSLIQVDDENRLWVIVDEAGGGPSFVATVDRSGALRKVYASIFARVSRSGHSLATVYDDTRHRRHYVDEREVDFEPVFVNDNGIVTAYSVDDTWYARPFIVYPDGRQEPVPKDPLSPGGSAIVLSPWIDSQGRLNGLNNRGYAPVLVEKKLGADGQPVPGEYVLIPYEPLPFPPTSTWTTDHKVAPRTYAQQLGIAVNSATGISRPFVATLNARLGVDANRDGLITSGPEIGGDEVSQEAPYRFWINDDDDENATSGDDAPGKAAGATSQAGTSGANYSTVDDHSYFEDTGWIDGARDLIDFFPVVLDFGHLIAAGPSDGTVKYRIKHEDEAVNVVVTSLRRADALKFQTDAQLANEVLTLQTHKVTAQGYEIEPRYLELYKNSDYGVVLVEGRKATDRPLVLSVEKIDGTVIAEVKLHLKISPVESMFRHMNLRDRNLAGLVGSKKDSAESEMMNSPAGFPDDPSSDGRWLIFVHGFNVSGKGARGWNAEMFKRCYWAGNKARFVGVSWFGNPDPGKVGLPADYHLAVRNAMVTAPVLAQAINELPGGSDTKTVFSHSLGCGVVSSAIVDHGMNIGRVCFVDAALARECFDGRSLDRTTESEGMTPAVWRPYSPRVYAANWFDLFVPTTDARGKLTWNNRFSEASSAVYNFYSSTEDVLAEYTGELPSTLGEIAWDSGTHGSFGWVFQEKGKGNRQNYGLGVGEFTHLGSYYGGWGMNLKDPVLSGDTPYWKWVSSDSYMGRIMKTPAEMGSVSDSVLRRYPVFELGWGVVQNQEQQESPVSNVSPVDGAPIWIYNLYLGAAGNALAGDAANRARLLAEAIPSLTWCIGSRKSESGIPSGKNFNLPKLVDQSNWPRGKPDGVTPEWRHSDIREVAYLYQSGVFDKIVELSKP